MESAINNANIGYIYKIYLGQGDLFLVRCQILISLGLQFSNKSPPPPPEIPVFMSSEIVWESPVFLTSERLIPVSILSNLKDCSKMILFENAPFTVQFFLAIGLHTQGCCFSCFIKMNYLTIGYMCPGQSVIINI